MKIIFSIVVIIAFIHNCLSQQKISGKITDEYGNPLKGVEIYIKGFSDNSTHSDLKGHYCLSVPDSNCILIFLLAGMIAEEVCVNRQKIVNISLKRKEIVLNENIIIGYYYFFPNQLNFKSPYPLEVPGIDVKSKMYKLLGYRESKNNTIEIREIRNKKQNIHITPIYNFKVKINRRNYYGIIDSIPVYLIESIDIKKKRGELYLMNSTNSINTLLIRLKHKKDLKLINPELFKK